MSSGTARRRKVIIRTKPVKLHWGTINSSTLRGYIYMKLRDDSGKSYSNIKAMGCCIVAAEVG